jgi:hypothetical protein
MSLKLIDDPYSGAREVRGHSPPRRWRVERTQFILVLRQTETSHYAVGDWRCNGTGRQGGGVYPSVPPQGGRHSYRLKSPGPNSLCEDRHCGQETACEGATPKSLHQDTRDQGGFAGDRGVAGVPANVTLLFSREQYIAAAEAYPRGIERRIAHGPDVRAVASLFVSRWDRASQPGAPSPRATGSVSRWRSGARRPTANCSAGRVRSEFYNDGTRPQRLLWASTGTKDPGASDILYLKALAGPFTVSTMPEGTVKAFAGHGGIGDILPADSGDDEGVLAQLAKAGIDIDALATKLRDNGAKSSVKSWDELMKFISAKSKVLAKTNWNSIEAFP